jgi:integrase
VLLSSLLLPAESDGPHALAPFRPFHDLRHTALTHDAAAGNPVVYIQMKAGHSQASITERYIHAAQIQFAGAAARAEERMFNNTD